MLPDFTTSLGKIVHRDSLEYMRQEIDDESVDLIITSPPFALLRKKDYGNVEAEKYLQWFRGLWQRILSNSEAHRLSSYRT